MVQDDMPPQGGDAQNPVQQALQGLWDRAQKAADMITELRSHNRELQARVEELETAMRDQQATLTDRDNKVKELQEKSTTLSSVDVGEGLLYLSPDEREALERQIDDLIARINAHLGTDTR
ncbi:cell division protein ZapB [bacterium]|nr:cell division protein ZapB [bacterium]